MTLYGKEKKNEFMKFFNSIDSNSIICTNQKLSPNLVQDLRQKYLSKSYLGMPEKKTLADYVKLRIKNEKIKEMIKKFLDEKYAETKAQNTDLINSDWEEEFNDYSQLMIKNMNLSDKKKIFGFI